MNVRLISAIALSFCCCSSALSGQQQHLTAPTYYISVRAQHVYDEVIRVRGASNLPPGAYVSLRVVEMSGDGWKDLSENTCVSINEKGLFDWQEMKLSEGNRYRKGLFVTATFLPNECKQTARVLQILGRHGEFLGHDDHSIKMHEVEMGLSRGMTENPQLFQMSGWYFGVSALARVD